MDVCARDHEVLGEAAVDVTTDEPAVGAQVGLPESAVEATPAAQHRSDHHPRAGPGAVDQRGVAAILRFGTSGAAALKLQGNQPRRALFDCGIISAWNQQG